MTPSRFRERHTSGTTSRGFTLIEVVLALAIASISLGALMGAMTQMVRGASSIQERTYASWIAQNRIAEMRLANVIPEVSSTTDEVLYGGFEWRVETTVAETGVENLYRIDVEVQLVGDEYPSGTVTGFIGEPTPPGCSNTTWQNGSQSTSAVC